MHRTVERASGLVTPRNVATEGCVCARMLRRVCVVVRVWISKVIPNIAENAVNPVLWAGSAQKGSVNVPQHGHVVGMCVLIPKWMSCIAGGAVKRVQVGSIVCKGNACVAVNRPNVAAYASISKRILHTVGRVVQHARQGNAVRLESVRDVRVVRCFVEKIVWIQTPTPCIVGRAARLARQDKAAKKQNVRVGLD